jgi:YgiT-type zinc finger domain-containing protein
MQVLKCLFCGKPTTIHKITMKKQISGKAITITNAPVHYCSDCKETFVSKEAQDIFSFIKKKNLQERGILFNFDEIFKRI